MGHGPYDLDMMQRFTMHGSVVEKKEKANKEEKFSVVEFVAQFALGWILA